MGRWELGNVSFFVSNNGKSSINCFKSKQPDVVNSPTEMPMVSVTGLLEAALQTMVWGDEHSSDNSIPQPYLRVKDLLRVHWIYVEWKHQ